MFFERDTIGIIKLSINHPTTIILIMSNSDASCFALPKDTLDIWLDLDASKKIRDNILFKGKTASISNYLTKAKINTSSVPSANESINEYNKRVDAKTEKGLTALYTFNEMEHLPDWYVKMEETDIHYSGAVDKVYQFTSRYQFHKQYLARPDNFNDKLRVKIDNPEAKYSERYNFLLCMLTTSKYDTLSQQNNTSEIFYNVVIENINFARKFLHSEIRDLFIAQRIGALLSTNLVKEATTTHDALYFKRVDSLITFAKTSFSDTVLLNVLFAYQKNQLKTAKETESLNQGAVAPDFKLTDLAGKTVSLSDFKGRFVCINFWATWCSPCIKSIPEKNTLQRKYKNSEIVFINVCVDSDNKKWESLIKDNDFQGVHLICKGDWINILYRSYYITGIPHYVLVDEKGKIIKNKVASINELEDLIKNQI
ncbi:MAG: TlpA disulfide reductase family protein [Sedimentibacter sp.]|uniref:TlpA family protein disulfide reductase n=1 Tax=Sedimentibacter sp. TaxID=1960295 RepID=UPI00298189FB|nr:TlpA disulfide reductase family protein [Sedimentibacter sp.]MDW5300170.1 TlpA disulfide reductase family protein [Sedimentibacter sp.]